MNPKFLRAAAAVMTAVGSGAGVIAANPDLLKLALPPNVAAAVTVASLVVVAVLHEFAHNTAPADPVTQEPSP